MGELPIWYGLYRAAKIMGVPPWELANRPVVWMEWALMAEGAENDAKADLERRAARKAKSKRK